VDSRGDSAVVELEQGSIAFRRSGDGPPLVLLHGAFADARDWQPQLDALGDEFTVVAWDAPGCGGSFDPPPDFGPAGWAGSLGREEAERRREGFLRDADRPLEEVVREFSTTLFTGSASPEVVDEAIDIMMGATRPAGMRAMGNAFADADLRDVLPTIGVPTLLIYGDADQRSPVSPVGEDLHASIPRSRLVVIEGPGHVVNLEAPERFNDEVRHFLRSVE
jgi:pimeloyl-ACP methyl ester carboxylesterase